MLTGRLHDAFGNKESHGSNHADGMTIDLEDSSAMDLDQENGGPKKRYFSSDVLFFATLSYMLYNFKLLLKLSVLPLGEGQAAVTV